MTCANRNPGSGWGQTHNIDNWIFYANTDTVKPVHKGQ